MVSLFSFISGSHHLWMAWSDTSVKNLIATGTSVYRHIDYSISASLMFVVNSILFYAPPDLQSIVNNFSIQFYVIALGFCSEQIWALNGKSAKWVFWIAVIPYATSWTLLWYAFVLSTQKTLAKHQSETRQ